MPMMNSDTAGAILGNDDGRMIPQGGADDQNSMVPCPACQGAGMVPPDQAEEITEAMGAGDQDQGQEGMEAAMGAGADTGGGDTGGPPKSPVTGRTGADIQSIRNYAASRPAQLQHQPIDEGAAAASGKRVRERMRRPGILGR